MRSKIGSLVAAVIAAILALLATPIPNAAAVAPGESLPVYAYDGTLAVESFDDAATERGPPAAYDRATTYGAVDRRSHGASGGPEIGASCARTAYDNLVRSARIDRGGTATQEQARRADGALSSPALAGVAAKSVDEAGALVKYDPMAASRNLLGQVGNGYAVTPGGRTISAHAAERIALGGPGRPPTTLARVDDILNNPTGLKYDPLRDTVKVMQGKDFVVVSGTGPQHIVTVMVR